MKGAITNKGFAIIEVMVGVLVTSMLATSFFLLVAQSLRMSRANMLDLRASLYLRELLEVATDLEQSNWAELGSPLSPCASPLLCHPRPESGAWTLAAGEESLDNGLYGRSLSIEPVCRSTLAFPNEIADCAGGGIPDPDTKKIVARIAWNDTASDRTSSLETYVYRHAP